jgi:hypothetical protein
MGVDMNMECAGDVPYVKLRDCGMFCFERFER